MFNSFAAGVCLVATIDALIHGHRKLAVFNFVFFCLNAGFAIAEHWEAR